MQKSITDIRKINLPNKEKMLPFHKNQTLNLVSLLDFPSSYISLVLIVPTLKSNWTTPTQWREGPQFSLWRINVCMSVMFLVPWHKLSSFGQIPTSKVYIENVLQSALIYLFKIKVIGNTKDPLKILRVLFFSLIQLRPGCGRLTGSSKAPFSNHLGTHIFIGPLCSAPSLQALWRAGGPFGSQALLGPWAPWKTPWFQKGVTCVAKMSKPLLGREGKS